MRDALNTKRTRRYVIGTVLTGRLVRSAADVATVAAQVAAGSLTSIDGTTFGLFDSPTADDSCSITSGLAVLTSPNNPWVAGDVGKSIDVQGAGVAGATLRSRIKAFTSAGQVTLWDNAGTTVAALVSSAGGLAIWGNDLTLTRTLPVQQNEAGTSESSKAAETIVATGSPLGRTLAARFADVTNVLDFRATGDGVTDDTAAIAAAISAAPTGGKLVFPPGTYLINPDANVATITDGTDVSNAGLLIAKALTLEGIGLATLKAKTGTGTATDNYLLSVTAAGFRMRGLHLDGNKANVVSSYGVQLNASDAVVEACDFASFDGSPVLAQGAVGARIDTIAVRDCTMNDNGNTIFMAWVDRFQITGNRVYNASEGIDLDKYCTRGVISGNVIQTLRGGGADAGVEVNGGTDIVISGNSITDFVHGVLLNAKTVSAVDYRCEWINVDGNEIRNSTGYGIVIGNVLAASDDARHCRLCGNIISGSSQDGINLRGVDMVVSGNVITGNSFGGILADAGGLDFVINDNIIRSNDRYGVQLVSVTGAVLSGNLIADNNAQPGESGGPFQGITLDTVVKCVVAGNRITGVHDYAVRTLNTSEVLLGTNSMSGYTQQALRWSSGTTLNLSGQSVGDVAGALNLSGGRFFFGTAKPASASLIALVGDVCWNTAAAAGGALGWYCTVAGSPGTWVAFGPVGYLEGSATIDPPSMTTNTEQTLGTTITVTGAAVGDYVQIAPPYSMQAMMVYGYVSGADTVTIRLRNGTGGTIDLASGTWKARVFK